ncbi:MAG: PQQ-binding-like beta-propeller repeat protein [Phycisphaeraceae bacterium]
MMRRVLTMCLLSLLVLLSWRPAEAVTLERVISREHPRFRIVLARMNIGHDGMLYFCNPGDQSFILRITPTGENKTGITAPHAAGNATANADGVIAVNHAHLIRRVQLYGQDLEPLTAVGDFLGSDQLGWNAPAYVASGASGDFYAADQHRNRIVRFDAAGKIVAAYSIPPAQLPNPDLPPSQANIREFDVSETQKAFYVVAERGMSIRCIGFDGEVRWEIEVPVQGNTHDGLSGAFDVDDEGVLHVLAGHDDVVHRYDAAGQAMEPIQLAMGELKPEQGGGAISDMAVGDGAILLRRKHPTELFQRYNLRSGELEKVIAIDHERLVVTYPDRVWTAGERVPFDIRFTPGRRAVSPRWRVWLRPFNSLDYRELEVVDGHVRVPEGLGGVYQVKVSPEVQPWQRGEATEYLVRDAVEVRAAGAVGSATVLMPGGRMHFAQGEPAPFTVAVRGEAPAAMTVRLVEGDRVLSEARQAIPQDAEELTFELPAHLTAVLQPGRYELVAEAEGLTSIAQPIEIGPGFEAGTPFFRVQFGDYGPTYPTHVDRWSAPDVVAHHLDRTGRLGVNLTVDRLGSHLQTPALGWSHSPQSTLPELSATLERDAVGTNPLKLAIDSPLKQIMGGYSSRGVHQMAIPLYMDAGLPLGSGYDGRETEQITAAIEQVTRELDRYPAFRGWVWSANWWHYNANVVLRTDEERATYEDALDRARNTGTWDPILGEIADRRYALAVDAQALFNRTLEAVGSDDLVTANSGPYRKLEAYPPTVFQNVDEVDLHVQWEQMAVPFVSPHSVDFYKRPGKAAWGHPEVWNDDGTGGQVVPTLMSMVMRGADGVGFSGNLPNWGARREDTRTAYHGTVSIYRALNDLLSQYGPWLNTLETQDSVAIVASSRMFDLDRWSPTNHVMGVHFSHVFEAYIACLFAHRPASIVFSEDLEPDTLANYRAVLLVNQRVEMDDQLTAALENARDAGVPVFYDGTCRESLVAQYRPLNTSFDHIVTDPNPAGDDSAYVRFPAYARAHMPALREALGETAPPVAAVDDEAVFVSERVAGRGRYLFVVNYATPDLSPGQMWRVDLFVTARVPMRPAVGLRDLAPGAAVYDTFAMRQVDVEAGDVVRADLRDLPARLFAILPAAIDHVALRGPAEATAGQALTWSVQVHDSRGEPIEASIPVRLRLLGADGEVLVERHLAADEQGAGGVVTAPINAPAGAQTLEATELLSGRQARLSVAVTPAELPVSLAAEGASRTAAPATAEATGAAPADATPAAADRFGPHIRRLVIADNGTAVASVMNWDHNLQAVDLETGQPRWRQRVGHYFSFDPRAIVGGVAVQGYDLNSAEGYHLYLLDGRGELERRVALYGLPNRLPQRFLATPDEKYLPINHFAMPADGRWIATAGDLGLAVWDRDGTLRWQQDWWKQERHIGVIAAVGTQTLLVVEGLEATAYDAATGEPRWSHTLASSGAARTMAVSDDAGTVAVLADTETGGRVFGFRDGQLIADFPTDASEVAFARDGSQLAVVTGNLLKLYNFEQGLQWIFSGDDALRSPSFSPDGQRLVVGSDLGSLYVLDRDGRTLYEHDYTALPTGAWLDDGDLLVGTWMGELRRLDSRYETVWRTRLEPEPDGLTGPVASQQQVPTTRVASWTNAEPQPRTAEANLLAEVNAVIGLVPGTTWGGAARLMLDPRLLHDGDTTAPREPWLAWDKVNHAAAADDPFFVTIESFRTRMRVEAVTFFEDPDHPEAWLRDATLEYQHSDTERWHVAMELLSDAVAHTHRLPEPVEASKWRIRLPWAIQGNLRLGEIVFHGETTGPAHPDLAAKRPVAVLMDEGAAFQDVLTGHGQRWAFHFDDAHSGGRSLQVRPGDSPIAPREATGFGPVVPTWDFPIAADPGPGEYRYLQFAYRAQGDDTTGVQLGLLGEGAPQTVWLHSGPLPANLDGTAHQVDATPSPQWRVVRVDLWERFGQPVTLRSVRFGAQGGPALIDQVLLGRTMEDLPAIEAEDAEDAPQP